MIYRLARLPVLFFLVFIVPANLHASDRGKSWFKLCKSCHGLSGEGRQDLGAPAIAGLESWYVEAQLYKFRDGIRGKHPKDIPGMRMRPMARMLNNDDDLKAVAQFVGSMPRPKLKNTVKGSVLKGEQTYQTCAACHGPDGTGNKSLNAPALVGASDWYLVVQLNNFKNRIRAYDPSTDPNGATMTALASMLNEESMANVVAYINALGSGGE